MQVTRIHESPRDPAVHRGAVGRSAGARRCGRPRTAGRRRAPHHGRRRPLAVGDRDAANGTPMRWALQARLCRRTGAQAAGAVRRGAASCTSARASGTRASRLRWPCRSAGAMASRAGATRAVRRRTHSLALHDAGCRTLHPQAHGAAGPHRPVHPSRLRGRLLLPVARAGCRSTWTPSSRGWTTRWSGPACAACSGRSWTRRSAMPCPCRRARPTRRCRGPAWQTGPWHLRDDRMYLLPGDSPWATACRWTRCRGPARATIRT